MSILTSKEITFNPSEKQFEAWEYLTDDTTTELGYGGAASGGKSYLGCFWTTAMCIAYPGTAWAIGRRELTTLKKTTLLTLFKVFNEYGIDESMYTYNQQINTLTFGNGSMIFFIDLDYKPSDPLYTRLGGLELTGGFVDESNECPEDGIAILKTRLGRRLNDKYHLKPKLLETFNPSKNHVYGRFYKPWKDGGLPAHRKFIQALPYDNPYTTEDYLDQLRNSDKITRMRLLEGNFEYDDDPAALIRFDYIQDLFTNTTIKTPNKYISADIARLGNDKTVIFIWDDLEVIHVEVLEKTTTDITAQRIKDLARTYQVPFSHIIIDEDGIGGGVVDQLSGCRGFIANTAPFEMPTFDKNAPKSNFGNLKSQCYFKLADYVNAHKIAVKLDDTLIRSLLAEELEQVKRKDPDKDGKLYVIPKDQVKENIGRSPDFADALMMRMWFELPKKNPGTITIRHGENGRRRVIINQAK